MKLRYQLAAIAAAFFLTTTQALAWNAGDRVSCNWKGGGQLYKGRVARVQGGNIAIQYDDGDQELTTPGSCQYQIGTPVQCYWKGGAVLYRGFVA
jgi:hypothetical protein